MRSVTVAVVPPTQARGDVVVHHFEDTPAGMQRLANQQLEGAFGGFQFVALMLQILDALQQLTARFGIQTFGQAMLLQFVQHIAAAGQIAQQNALPVADHFRLDVLVGGGILQYRADMHAALVGERAVADVGLIVAHRQIRQLGDVARHRGQRLQILAADGGVAELQLQIRDDGHQVGVAAALAIAVDAALHVRASGFHRGDGIGHGDIAIVVRMDAEHAVEALANFRNHFHDPMRQIAAVGVAQAQHVGAGFLRGFQRTQREIWVGVVAVEEVLGVVHHFAAVVFQVLYGFPDQQQILLFVDAQRAMDVQIPALAENRDRRGFRFEQRAHVGVLIHRVLGEARGAERGQPGVLQLHILGALEELLVLGIGVGPPALNVIDTQLVQLLRDDQFVVDGE